jgi:excinuclease UvrABC ATPase subunit
MKRRVAQYMVSTECPLCHGKRLRLESLAVKFAGARYNTDTLKIKYREKSIADVLGMTVDAAWEFFADEPHLHRSLTIVREVGLGYLRLGQPATELSGGEAQRIKLATELQRIQRGDTLYVLDEPTTGLHPADVERLISQLDGLVEACNTVIVVEHDMRVAARSDWVMDLGPGAGDEADGWLQRGRQSKWQKHQAAGRRLIWRMPLLDPELP